IEWRAPEGAQQCCVRYSSPERLKSDPGSVRTIFDESVHQNGRIHGAGRCARDAIDLQPGLLQNAIEHPPGEGALSSAALEGKIDEDVLLRSSTRSRHVGPRFLGRSYFSADQARCETATQGS